MALAAVPDPQTTIEERVIDDADLVELLDRRQAAKVAAGEAAKAKKDADDAVKAKIEELNLEDGAVVRVGWFRIKKWTAPARDVAFSTSPASRITIRKLADEG